MFSLALNIASCQERYQTLEKMGLLGWGKLVSMLTPVEIAAKQE